jgi:hypothetical protein
MEVKKQDVELLGRVEERELFKDYMEDYNTGEVDKGVLVVVYCVLRGMCVCMRRWWGRVIMFPLQLGVMCADASHHILPSLPPSLPTGTLPHRKFYNLEIYEREKAAKRAAKGIKDAPKTAKQVFNSMCRLVFSSLSLAQHHTHPASRHPPP